MSSTSPSPNSPLPVSPPTPAIVPPQSNTPPPLPDSPPSVPPTQPSSPPPIVSPPPMQSPPPPLPPLTSPSPPNTPPPVVSPPPITPPPQSPPNAPPPQPSIPPRTSPPPPVTSDPPILTPPSTSAPPPSISSPPPPPQTPNDPPSPQTPSPPPPRPPRNSPPPPSRSPNPPDTSPPPPSGSPPPPSSTPPRESPSFPPPPPPTNSSSPIVPISPPLNSPPGTLPPPVSPPPRSPPPPSTVPSGNNNNNTSSPNGNAPETPPSSSGIGTGGTVAIVAVVVLLLLGIFGTAAFCCWKRKKKGSLQNGGHIMPTSVCSTESDSVLLKVRVDGPNNRSDSLNGGMGNSRSWFTYEELAEATNGFSAENILGKGGFGSVYKGSLVDGRVVAVKQLNIGGGQGEREFRSEVEIISRIHHRHLVSLVGYCISDENRLLVYEYVPNDTLYFHLHAEGQPVIDWGKRVKIAMGAARGLAYLHEDCHPRIIHRDIKSSNILLDNNFEARVADFGLAKLVAMDANTHITTRVMGTFGYMAPEYASSGKLTEKSDVYSFGVVLLELITGRKSVDTSQPLGEESLVEWARPLLSHAIEKEELESLADPRLDGDYVDGEMFQMIQAAAACVRHSASKRPKMGQVVRAFDDMVTPDLTNGMKVGESEIYNSAQQSAEIRLFQRMAFGSHEFSTDFFSHSSSGVSEGNHVNSRSQRN